PRCGAALAPVLPATQSIALDSAFPSLAVARCVPQSLSSLEITTSPPSAVMSGTCARRRTILTVRKRSERASCSTSWAHRRTGGGLDQPVAQFKIVLDHSHHPGCNRIHQSL